MTEYSKMSVAELLSRIDDSVGTDDASQALRVLQVKLASDANNLTARLLDSNDAAHEVAVKKLAASDKANSLAEQLLLSNEQERIQNDKNAKLTNIATQVLADSTKWLKWATWALVLFTAVQAAIALAALLKN